MLLFACCIHKEIDLIEKKKILLNVIHIYLIHIHLGKIKIGQSFDPTTCQKIGPRTINPYNAKKIFPSGIFIPYKF